MIPVIVFGHSIPQGRSELDYASNPPDFPVKGSVFDKRTITVKELGRHIKMMMEYGKEAGEVDLGRAFAEKIMLTVAIENRCRHCYAAHTTFARNHGVSEEFIKWAEDLPEDKLGPEEYAALRYARAWAEGEEQIADPGIIEKLDQYYSEEEIAWINEMIVLMCFANRTANTFDALLSRTKGKPRPRDDGGIGSELVLSGVFLMVAVPIEIYIKILNARLNKKF